MKQDFNCQMLFNISEYCKTMLPHIEPVNNSTRCSKFGIQLKVRLLLLLPIAERYNYIRDKSQYRKQGNYPTANSLNVTNLMNVLMHCHCLWCQSAYSERVLTVTKIAFTITKACYVTSLDSYLGCPCEIWRSD